MGNSPPQENKPAEDDKKSEEKLQQDIDTAFKDLIESMDKMDKHLEDMVQSYKAENDEAERNRQQIQNQ